MFAMSADLGLVTKIYLHWHWISTQTCGWCLGYILFTTLESAGYITFSQVLLFSFCATQIISLHHIFCFFLSNPNGLHINQNSLTNMGFNFQFLFFWGIVFLVTTTLIGDCLKNVSWKSFPFFLKMSWATTHGSKNHFLQRSSSEKRTQRGQALLVQMVSISFWRVETSFCAILSNFSCAYYIDIIFLYLLPFLASLSNHMMNRWANWSWTWTWPVGHIQDALEGGQVGRWRIISFKILSH